MHWEALRTAVESRGMGHLIAANGRDAAARMVAEIEGKAGADDFEPLMTAHNMIWSRALSEFGIGIMGDYCPVCEFIKAYPPPPEGHRYKNNEEYFIDGPADAVLSIATERGLMT